MLKFEQKGQKKWNLIDDIDFVFEFNLVSSSITNKFFIVTSFIEGMSKEIGEGFDTFLMNTLYLYASHSEEGRFGFLLSQIPEIKAHVNEYMKIKNIDYDQFVDMTKAKKSSILFEADEIRQIIELSAYLKVYSLISNTDGLRLDARRHKKIYNEFAKEIAETEIMYKIFNVIKTKTFRYNLTDRYMWDYIKMIQCKTVDIHVVEIFNFIMNSIIVLCEEHRNPITYFVGVIEESVNWFLRSVYKGSIIYDDSVATEDIHGLNVNNLKTYAYNDTLGRLKGIAYEQIYDNIERNTPVTFDSDTRPDRIITEFQSRISEATFISPLCECLVFPVLSLLTKIPYNHFRTLSPEHSAVLSVYAHRLLKRTFKGEYSHLLSLLDYYPVNQPALATTYKLKAIHDCINLQNEVESFFGFRTKIIPVDIISFFVGRISRINFLNIMTGVKLTGIPLSKVEGEMIRFYTLMFAGKLEPDIERMRKSMNDDF